MRKESGMGAQGVQGAGAEDKAATGPELVLVLV